mmetsp:Transcript_34118/g.55700  ORF Transcript_34118/g.55700 Transcript_34118/m.55700 type:complete len:440 (+) Transcript_34118:100-1419(+)
MSSLRLAIKRSLKDMPAAPRIGNSDSDKPQRRQKSSLVDSINASSNCKTDTLMEKCSAITESRKNEGPNSSDNDAIDNNNDSDDEELGALIYKWSRTAKLKAEASSSKTAQMSSSSTESISSQQTPRQQDGKLNMSMKRKHHPSITESDANITICARHTDHLQCAHFGVHVDGRDIVEDSVEESNNVNVGDVGYTFRKQFGDDWYTGKVVRIQPGPRTRAAGAGQKEDRQCLYEDGDAEDLSLPELRELALLDPENKFVCKPNIVPQHSQGRDEGHESKLAKCNHKVCVNRTTCRVKPKPKCSHEECTHNAIKGGVCRKHGEKSVKPRIWPKAKCSHEECTNKVVKGGVCWRHGAKNEYRCTFRGCVNYAQRNGVCTRHGAKRYHRKVCKHDGCTSFSQVDGACYKHGTNGHCRKTCSREGCNNLAQKGGVCRRHGANI